jgi:pimeloyl-ACP methyl ester carboxylesterase
MYTHALRFRLSLITILFLAAPLGADAALTDGQRCLLAKHKAVGKDRACRLKALASAVVHEELYDSGDCDYDLDVAFDAAEDRYGDRCRTTGDADTLSARGNDLTSDLAQLLVIEDATGDEAVCISAKAKAIGRFAVCLEKVAVVQIARELPLADFTRCEEKLDAAIAKAGTACEGEAESLRSTATRIFRESEADLADLGTDEFARRGRYGVGTRTVTFVDSSRPTQSNGSYSGAPDRTFVVSISYPLGSSVDRPEGFPLIVRAHGFSGFRGDSSDLTNHLASRGFVVASPDFPLSNLNAPGGPTLLDLDEQVIDVGFLIDSLIALDTTDGDPFIGKLDTSRVGIIGHSLGGATVLGAGYHPTLADSRVDAVVAMAPLACIFGPAFYQGGSVGALLVLSGDGDLVTPPASNHVAAYDNAPIGKYFASLEGGLHIGFSNDFLNDDSVNADDVLACPAVLPPGAERPTAFTVSLPSDYLGGAAAGVDTTGSTCEPVCPLPGPTWMTHARQRDIQLAASTALFEKQFDGNLSADRLLTWRLDADNDDVITSYQR